jgi:sugar lactone lactonase YvrE
MRILLCLLCCLAFSKSSHSQTVSTFVDVNIFGARITDALLFDNQGNLYGADYSGNSVYKISPTGSVSTLISGLNSPNGLALDSQGNLFICDNTGNNIYKIDGSGSLSDSFAITSPAGIIKDLNSDTLFFTTYTGNQLMKLAPDGSILPWFSGSPLNGPVGLCYDNQGQLYLANFNDRNIYRVYRDSLQYLARLPGTTSSALGSISYAFGSIWATNLQNHKIYRVFKNYQDSVVLYAGSTAGFTDGALDSAKFRQPNGIVAKNDSLFISEFATGNIRIIANIDADLRIVKKPVLQPGITVYPNPASAKVYLQFTDGPRSFDYEIIDEQGALMQSGQNEQSPIDISTLKKGLYLLKIQREGNPQSFRLLKT